MKRHNLSCFEGDAEANGCQRMRFRWSVWSLLALSLITGEAPANIAVTGNPAGNPKRLFHFCTGTQPNRQWCSTQLTKGPIGRIAPPAGGDNFYDHFGAGGTQFTGWTVTQGMSLNGNVNVEYYGSRLCHPISSTPGDLHCVHAGTVKLKYEPAGNDPGIPQGQSRQWIQQYTTTGGYCGPRPAGLIPGFAGPFAGTYIDAFPDIGPYYNAIPTLDFYDRPMWGCLVPPRWPGNPRRCPCGTHAWGMSFRTFLATGTAGEQPGPPTGGSGTMTVHDGVEWGMSAQCACENLRAPPRWGTRRGNTVHGVYDPATETLSFTPDTVSVLTMVGFDGVDPAYQNDPLLDAIVTIGDFTLGAIGPDYVLFTGGSVLVSSDLGTFMSAELPALWIVDDMSTSVGYNMLAPYYNLELNTGLDSEYLQDFSHYLASNPEYDPDFTADTDGAFAQFVADGLPVDKECGVLFAVCSGCNAEADTTDTDGDGIYDRYDNCEQVYNPRQVDTDYDGVGDACDGCPDDVYKDDPGACGCGVYDRDSDSDSVPDCDDQCPGEDDTVDYNENGIPDCTEAVVPSVSPRGLLVVGLLLLMVGAIVIRRRLLAGKRRVAR